MKLDFIFNKVTGLLYLLFYYIILGRMSERARKITSLVCKEIDIFTEITPDCIISFIGIILNQSNSIITLEFDKQQLQLRNQSGRTYTQGSIGKVFAVVNSDIQGDMLAFTPVKLDQISRYKKIKKLERIYHEKT